MGSFDVRWTAGIVAAAMVCALSLIPRSASAQDAGDTGDAGDADDVDLDPRRFTAFLDMRGSYTENFFYQTDTNPSTGAKNPQTDAAGTVIRPGFRYITETRHVSFDTEATGTYGSFDLPGTYDDYLDGIARAHLEARSSVRTRFSLSGGVQYGHDPFGLERTEGGAVTTTEIDRWRTVTANARYAFGSPGAILNAELGVNLRHKQYTTNESATRFLNSRQSGVNYTLFYRLSPRTSALVDFGRVTVDYDADNDVTATTSRDTREGVLYRARAGARWLATAKTSGDVRVGYRMRTFDQTPRRLERLDWDAGVNWSPVALTTLRLHTGRTEQDAYLKNQTRAIDVVYGGIEWEQGWSARTKTGLGVEYTQADFIDGGRRDDNIRYSFDLDYIVRTHVSLVAGAMYQVRESTFAGRDFDHFQATLGIRIGM